MTNSTNSHAKFSNIFVQIYICWVKNCIFSSAYWISQSIFFIYLYCKPVSLTFFKVLFFPSVTFDMIKAWNTYLFAMKQWSFAEILSWQVISLLTLYVFALYNKDRGGLAIFKQHAGKKLSENSSATGVLF